VNLVMEPVRLTIRPVHEGEVAWKELQAAAANEMVSSRLYSEQEVAAMHSGGFVASWMLGPKQLAVTLGAVVDGAVVGCIQLWRRADGTGVLEYLFVQHSYRESGIGTQLVKDAVSFGAQQGVEMIEVFAMEREPKAVRFWERRLGPADQQGQVMLVGKRFPARGWRMPPLGIGRRFAPP